MPNKWTKERKDARKLILEEISKEIEEELVLIPRFPNYAASPSSRIWYVNPNSRKSLLDREIFPYPTKSGYLGVWISQAGKKPKYKMLHKVIASVFLGPKPSSKHLIRHRDGNSYNNSAENLKWGTYKENSEDLKLHKQLRSVLTPALEEEILSSLRENSSIDRIKELSEHYNVSKLTIARLLSTIT